MSTDQQVEAFFKELRPLTQKRTRGDHVLAGAEGLQQLVVDHLGRDDLSQPDKTLFLEIALHKLRDYAIEDLRFRGITQRSKDKWSCQIMAASEAMHAAESEEFRELLDADEKARNSYELARQDHCDTSEGLNKIRIGIWLNVPSLSSGHDEIKPSLKALICKLEKRLASKDFVRALLQAFDTKQDARPSPRTVVTNDFYVSRHQLHEKLEAAIDRGRHIVCLFGDRGYGKSTVARAFAHDFRAEGRDVLWLDASDEASLYRDIAGHLAERRMNVADKKPFELRQELAVWLAGQAARRPVLVFDNVRDWKLAKAVIVPSIPVFYLLTSNNGALLPTGVGESIEVESMTEREADEMAKCLLQDQVGEAERKALITRLNCRPLAIEHACGHLRRTQQTVEGFHKLLDTCAARFFNQQSEGVDQDQLLTLVYRNVLADLGRTCPEAVTQLKLIASGYCDRFPRELLKGAYELLISNRRGWGNRDPNDGFFSGLDELIRLRIVTADDRFVYVHSLTQEILRGVLRLKLAEPAVSIMRELIRQEKHKDVLWALHSTRAYSTLLEVILEGRCDHETQCHAALEELRSVWQGMTDAVDDLKREYDEDQNGVCRCGQDVVRTPRR